MPQGQQPGKQESPEEKRNRAFETAMKSYWQLGLKLAGLEVPKLRLQGMTILNSMLPQSRTEPAGQRSQGMRLPSLNQEGRSSYGG